MPCRLGKQLWDKLLLSLGPSQEDRPQLPRQMLHVHLELELELKQLLPWRLGKQLRDTLLLPYRLDKEEVRPPPQVRDRPRARCLKFI